LGPKVTFMKITKYDFKEEPLEEEILSSGTSLLGLVSNMECWNCGVWYPLAEAECVNCGEKNEEWKNFFEKFKY
jgi:hypothetical protein